MSAATKNQLSADAATSPAITVNPERVSGQSVIGISRIPVAAILDHVNRTTFQRDFPTIKPEELENAIEYLKELAEDGLLGERVTY